MSYQVLARKWRPRNFETLVGQEHVVRALRHALDGKRLHHAWLFTGTRGVGKTTLSRILAKCLNCVGIDGHGDITSTPCGVCAPCTEIDAGRFVDYIEMDAASNRGVDEMTALLEQAVYAPSNARFKVYMIDEVHMLTSHAFNAMLKTLEEPPEHVKFILATTDPQKIPVTVLSRCLQFNLKQMPLPDITRHLADVLGQEGIAYERGALQLLARAAAGSMRDALSLTDQAIAYSAGNVATDITRDMLGALDETYLLRILDALADGDGPALMTIVDEVAARSLSFGAALQELGGLLHRLSLRQLVPGRLSDGDVDDDAHLAALASRVSADDVQLWYQIAAHGRRDLALAPDEVTGFSMTLLRMLAFRIDQPQAAASIPPRTVGRPAASPPEPVAARARPAAPAPVPAPPPSETIVRKAQPAAVVSSSSAPAAPAASSLIIEDWVTVVGQLGLTGLTRELVQQTELVAHDDRSVTLRVPIKSLLSSGNTLEKLKAALAKHFGKPVAVTIEVGVTQGVTVAAVRRDERTALQANAQAMIDADPFVQAVVRDFGGATVVPGSVKPV
jgi:DNA polymerase-3 subunit gamma/tau